MNIASSPPPGTTSGKYPPLGRDQTLEGSATTFRSHSIRINNPACHHMVTSDSIQVHQNWREGQLGKYTDLLFRFVHGDIYRCDYQQLHTLGLLSFRDILALIQPATVDTLPNELLTQIFNSNLCDFKEIPESQLTQDTCNRIFRLNEYVFQYIPDQFKTLAMCTKAVKNDYQSFQYVPGKMITESLTDLLPQFLTCFFFDPKSIPDHAVFEQLRKKMSPSISMRYPLIMTAPAERDYQCYLQACRKSWHSFKLVPDALKTKKITLAAINDSHFALSYVREKRRTPTLCDAAFSKSVYSLAFIPQHLITEHHRDTLIKACVTDESYSLLPLFHFIPEKLRTPDYYQVCVGYCLKRRCFHELIKFSQPFLHTILPDLLHGLKSESTPLDRHLQELLPVAYAAPPSQAKEELICFIKGIMLNKARDVAVNQIDFYSWMAIQGLEKEFKLTLLYLVNHPTRGIQLREETAARLINPGNPLTFQITNKMLAELKSVCQQGTLAKMPEQDKGDRLEQFINRELAKQSVFNKIPLPEFTSQNTICQGRTLIFSGDQQPLYFKLQRWDEDASELVKECLMHRYLHGEGKVTELGLKSEIPVPVHLCKLPWYAIPKSLRQSLNEVELRVNEGQPYAFGYCYTTSSLDYANYAWRPASDSPEAPCAKAVAGMLRAIHDLARWCAMGFLHTSTIPAFHVKRPGRRWLALNSLFRTGDLALCGRLDFLNDENTGQPDYRHSGLADLVDYERFGQLKSYFSHDGDRQLLHFQGVGQNVCLANYIVEVLVANVLLYGRLHRDQPDYHIDSEEANLRLGEFISQLMQQFLLGLLKEEHPSPEQWLCTSPRDFQAWLRRSVREVLYWTTSSESTRNFATDYQRDHHFDSRLYLHPPGDIDGVQDKQYPKEFSNSSEQPTVGVENGTFPFMSLTQGFTKFAATIIHTLSQQADEQNTN